jgi:hypothetical protein
VLPGSHQKPEQQPHGAPQPCELPHVPPLFGPSGRHVSPPGHASQPPPPEPHADGSLPSTHVAPWQQPKQFAGPQPLVVWHCPLLHACPGRQNWHARPIVPHAWIALGSWHSPLESQHPAQLVGPQPTLIPPSLPPLPTHAPPAISVAQVNPGPVHCVQARPCEPQSFVFVPGRHVLAAQQPAQFAGPHSAAPSGSVPASARSPHVPPCMFAEGEAMQSSPIAVQSTQVCPPKPHAVSLVPGLDPLAPQQPTVGGQLAVTPELLPELPPELLPELPPAPLPELAPELLPELPPKLPLEPPPELVPELPPELPPEPLPPPPSVPPSPGPSRAVSPPHANPSASKTTGRTARFIGGPPRSVIGRRTHLPSRNRTRRGYFLN